MSPWRGLALGLVLACPACSAFLSKRPPARVDPGTYPECGVATSTLAADVILTALMTTMAVASVASGEGDEPPTFVGAAGVFGFGISAVHGFTVRAGCREAHRQAGRDLNTSPLVIRPASGQAPLPPAPLVVPPGAPLPVLPPPGAPPPALAPAPDAGAAPDASPGG
jgi:hypothetical protein